MNSYLGIIFRMIKEILDSIIETRLHFINKMNQILQHRAEQNEEPNN